MVGILKKITPFSRSMSGKDFEDFNAEFSIAIEYTGSPVDHSLPRALPVDIDRIPTAKVATASPALFNNLSLTVVQPVGTKTLRASKDARFGSRACDSKHRVTHLMQNSRDSDDHVCSSGFDRSGSLKNSKDCAGDGEDVVFSGKLEEDLPKSSNGNESSGTLGFSDSQDHSHELSESSDIVETPTDLNHWNASESSPAHRAISAEISVEEEEESDGEALVCRRKRRPAVTFCQNELGEGIHHEDIDVSHDSMIQEPRLAQRPGKRGQCYHCLKGSRLTDKEVCISCNAKYCMHCIVRVMGSMPEGRKCLRCLGFPVLESKRHVLGKPSRMLRRLFPESEVKQIMASELSCAANQLSAESIYVNGSPLCWDELMELQRCANPPRSLKPGKYWYDKVAGFWGKEGHKPCQIITPKLNVGGDRIKREASNGNTKVLINNREITKFELWMLKSAGVQCAGHPTFWVDPDGSYQEEGMGRIKGKIWSKKITKLLCTLLALPTPESPIPRGKPKPIGDGALQKYADQRSLCRFLLVGNDQSGTSAIYKQARVLYNFPFSEEELESIKLMIQSTLYGYLARLLEGREQFEEESLMEMRRRQFTDPGPSAASSEIQEKTEYTIGRRLKALSDWLIQIMVSGNLDIMFPAATREYAQYVEDLWKDAAIQATYSRRNELELPRAATYFLDRAVEIAKVDYKPSEIDILYAEGISTSNGLVSMDFSFPKTDQDSPNNPEDNPDPTKRCQLVRVHAKSLGENCKWLEMFEDVRVVLFCVSLTEYDEYEFNSKGVMVNKMLESKRLFEMIVNKMIESRTLFEETNFLLLLNKFDLLEEKIDKVPLTRCEWFKDFNPVISRRNRNNMAPLAQTAFHCIALKFKRIFASLTGRKLYVCPVTALESDTVDSALRYAREIVRWVEDKPTFSLIDSSYESIEQSSTSIFEHNR